MQSKHRNPEQIRTEIEETLSGFKKERQEVVRAHRAQREQALAQRRPTVIGKLLYKLGIRGEIRDNAVLDKKVAEVHERYMEKFDEAEALREELRLAEFCHAPVPKQTRRVEYAAWKAIYERPRTIDRTGMSKQYNRIEKDSPKLDLSYSVDLRLPTYGVEEESTFRFAGPRVPQRLPAREEEWMTERGRYSEHTVYLTNAYDVESRDEVITVALDHATLAGMTDDERYDILGAGYEAAWHVSEVNSRDRDRSH